jgi:plasmid replication initiation protein
MFLYKSPKPLKSKTSKIYKNKKLNNANFGDFNHNDYQVFLHLISKMAGVDRLGKYLQPEQLQREYVLTAKEFSEVFETDLSYCYKLLQKSCKKLMKTSVLLERPELSEIWEINVCSMAKYNKNQGTITVEFTDRIMPYLAQVRKKFVLYNLKEISRFGSLYTTRFYELLQEFKETGWMVKSIKQLREIFAIGDKFKTYNNFKQRTFGHACQEINDNYDMGLKFEEIKEGRKVVAVKFFFKKTAVCKRIDQDGNIHTTYDPPKLKKKVQKVKKDSPEKVLDGQLSFIDTKDHAKPIKGILSSILSKFTSNKD